MKLRDIEHNYGQQFVFLKDSLKGSISPYLVVKHYSTCTIVNIALGTVINAEPELIDLDIVEMHNIG